MGTLASALAEAERIYRTMRALGERGDAKAKDDLIGERSRYGMQMLEVLQAIKTDPRLQSDPARKAEFERRFFTVRKMLADHQAKWRLDAISADQHGYLSSARALSLAQDDFYHWVATDFSRH
ncbi:MAG: hypothetical protein KDE15_12415 [Erythrobacter sp.]|nr:hypothetical protein [Erythrobacter sp.]